MRVRVLFNVDQATKAVDVIKCLKIAPTPCFVEVLYVSLPCLVRNLGQNRGAEISSEVAEGKMPFILRQVASGGAVRMALISLLAG